MNIKSNSYGLCFVVNDELADKIIHFCEKINIKWWLGTVSTFCLLHKKRLAIYIISYINEDVLKQDIEYLQNWSNHITCLYLYKK